MSSPRNPIQSFKQISVDGPASRASGVNIQHVMAVGVDNYTGPSASNDDVPTGATITSFNIQLSLMNLVSVALVASVSIQHLRANQSSVNPLVQGGNPQRNQIFYTRTIMLGQNQNNNMLIQFKVPRAFQRVREGDQWILVYRGDAVYASISQIIYKFYR